MNFKKASVLVLVILAIGGYIVYQKFSSPGITPLASSEALPPSSILPAGNSNGAQNKGSVNSQNSKYRDGSYTGQTTDAFYGPLQVMAVIRGGKISDVQFLQYPSGSGHSMEVSNMSLPILKQEAIQSQSANVDIVSGATQTSEAFSQSLQSALSQAL